MCELSAEPLTKVLDEALRLLLESHQSISYRETGLDHTAETAAAMRAWEKGFDVLR